MDITYHGKKGTGQSNVSIRPFTFNHTVLQAIGNSNTPLSILDIKSRLQEDPLAITLSQVDKSTGSISGCLNRLYAGNQINRSTEKLHQYTISEQGKRELSRVNDIIIKAQSHMQDRNFSPHP